MYHALILTISLLLPLITAQIDSTSGFGVEPRPNSSYLDPFSHHPNATGVTYISAVNTSFSNPNLGLTPAQWTAQINVTEVPWHNETITSSVISLYTPDNIFASNSSWDTCIVQLVFVAQNVTEKGQDDEGGCEQVFGKDCVGNFTAMIASKSADAAKKNVPGPCRDIAISDIPVQCAGSFDHVFEFQNIYPNETRSLSQSWDYSLSEPHDPSNTTYYEEAVKHIWPLVLVQSPKNSFNDGAGFTSAKMACLRAKNITEGSKKVDGTPNGAGRIVGMSFGGFLGWVVGVVMVVACVI
ncbi:hypothetical protein CJF32_00005586 [Rutstroemia sp. NJR-2017a WRK4]|nr:hypothetical protein CJF32_00005586 [Rutstroemia sp. NJR-2017a WRK4]